MKNFFFVVVAKNSLDFTTMTSQDLYEFALEHK